MLVNFRQNFCYGLIMNDSKILGLNKMAIVKHLKVYYRSIFSYLDFVMERGDFEGCIKRSLSSLFCGKQDIWLYMRVE